MNDGQALGPYDDYDDIYETMDMSPGEHTINYIDSYGDGWHGGYWEILPGVVDALTASQVSAVAGGPTDGLVEGSGGSTTFTIGSSTQAASVADSTVVAVHITTVEWAGEITWNVDGGITFGESPAYTDNEDFYTVLSLTAGPHIMNVMDSYGDGWHGGTWEVLDGCSGPGGTTGPLAGPATVDGSGGEIPFTVVECGQPPAGDWEATNFGPQSGPAAEPAGPEGPELGVSTVIEVETNIIEVAVDGNGAAATTGMTTYRAQVGLPASARNVYTIFGSEAAPATIPAAFQVPPPFGTHIGGANPAFFPFSAAAEYDSWLTVGPTDGSAEGAISQVGFDFESW